VIDSLPVITTENGAIDQRILRYFIGLSPSYLITDVTTSMPVKPIFAHPDFPLPLHSSSISSTQASSTVGIETWNTGFLRLVDLLLALHSRGELELETLNEASRACSECWTVASSWPGGGVGEQSREKVRHVAGRLRGILDPNRRTYRGYGFHLTYAMFCVDFFHSGLVYVP